MDHGHRIELVLGPMYSGKTSELLRRVRRHGHAKRKCVVIKFAGDQRYADSDTVATHDRTFMAGVAASTLMPLLADARVQEALVVAIDEGQFFPDVVEFSEACAASGKVVIVAALDGCFRRRPFGRVLELVPLADSVVKLTAVCHSCAGEAAFTKRTVASQELQLIGGAEAYVPVCRVCFMAEPAAPEAAAAAAKAEAQAEAGTEAPAPASARKEAPSTPLSSGSGSPTTPLGSSGGRGAMTMTPDPLPLPAGALGEPEVC